MTILSKKEAFKEKISLKKDFVKETLLFENKIFFAALAFVAAWALFIFQHPEYYNGWYVLGIVLVFYLLETAVQTFRVKKFNEVMQEIDLGRISSIQMRPINYPSSPGRVAQVNQPRISQTSSTDNEKELSRLSVLALFVAIMFGILQIFPEGKTFDAIGIGPFLKVTASTSLYFPFILFAGYLLLLGHSLRYKKHVTFPRLQAFCYDLGILLTICIVLFAILFIGLIALLVAHPGFPMWIVVSSIWLFIVIAGITLYFSIRDHFFV